MSFPKELVQLVSAHSRGDVPADVLAHRLGRITMRAVLPSGSIVLKLWELSDRISRLRQITKWTKGRQEWQILNKLYASGVSVPTPLYFLKLSADTPHREALILSDLGDATPLGLYIHHLSKSNNIDAIERLNNTIIDITTHMLKIGITDNDHRLNNFLIGADGRIWRIDFENAAHFSSRIIRGKASGSMLAALIASHAWMCRFTPDETRRFAVGLKDAVRPTQDILVNTRKKALVELQRLEKRSGFKLDMDIGW